MIAISYKYIKVSLKKGNFCEIFPKIREKSIVVVNYYCRLTFDFVDISSALGMTSQLPWASAACTLAK